MERKPPDSLSDVMVEILSSLDAMGTATLATAEGAASTAAAVEHVASAHSARMRSMLRRLTVLTGLVVVLTCVVILMVAVVLAYLLPVVGPGARASQRDSTTALVCSILNDARTYHGQPTPAPGCPPP